MSQVLSRKETEKYARATVTDCMRIGRKPDGHFETVWIMYNWTDPTCQEFARKVEEECWRVGAHTLMDPYSSVRSKLMLGTKPDESLSEINPLPTTIASTVDVRLFIGEQDDPQYAAAVPDKFKLAATTRTRVSEIISERKIRWLYFGWPLPGAAKGYGMPVPKFRRIFFNSIRESFSKKMLDLVKYYKDALTGKNEVRIEDDAGTDLSFQITGRPLLVDDGIIGDEDLKMGDVGLNIPSGETFVAPLETTANGTLKVEASAIPPFGKVKGLTLHFKDGRVESFEAVQGKEIFRKFLDSNTGDKDRIAELGIGCNPGAEYTGGSIIIDEKIYRTVHIAIGNNTGAYHGVNKASSHLDMIKDMRKGRLYADGELVMKNGVPLSL
jgi:aminopeptidase